MEIEACGTGVVVEVLAAKTGIEIKAEQVTPKKGVEEKYLKLFRRGIIPNSLSYFRENGKRLGVLLLHFLIKVLQFGSGVVQ